MKISLIIPIYNEEKNLSNVLPAIDKFDFGIEKELIFIDDKSKDRSLAFLESYQFKSEYKILHHKHNQGKGAALRTGFQECTGDIAAIQDADFEYQPSDLKDLLSPILNNQADVVYGSRFRRDHFQVHRTFHYLANRFLTFLSNIFSGIYLTDMETCYKVFRADIIKNIRLKSNRFGFEPEVTAKLAKLNIKIQELPISYYPRNYIEGKKISWKDGIAAIFHIIRFNLFENCNKKCFFPEMPKQYLLDRRKWL